MFIKTKGMTIQEITHVGVMYPAVLCKFIDGEHEICTVDYGCDRGGKNVIMKGYPVGWNPRNSGKAVAAYDAVFDEKSGDIRNWHGDYTDETEPKKDERCYILIERKQHGHTRYEIKQAVYDGKSGFIGWKESAELSILGFMHIRKNGMPF